MSRFVIGQFRERAVRLRLTAGPEVLYWLDAGPVFVKAQRQERSSLFSSIGLSAESWQFTVRAQDLTVTDALLFDGHHHFITAIDKVEPGFWVVQTARVQIAACQAGRETGGGLKFPAVLTEKYMKHEQLLPMAVSTVRYVLVTPKQVELALGSLVEVNGVVYPVQAAHTLDAWKNEYEIQREADL